MSNHTKTPKVEKTSPEVTFLSRGELCSRWGVSVDFLRSQEAAGRLHPIRLSPRCVRYRLSEIEGIESGAEFNHHHHHGMK